MAQTHCHWPPSQEQPPSWNTKPPTTAAKAAHFLLEFDIANLLKRLASGRPNWMRDPASGQAPATLTITGDSLTTGSRDNHTSLVHGPKDKRLQEQLGDAVAELQSREGRACHEQAPLNPTLL